MEESSEPVSPTGQYFTSSVISVSVIAVLESENPIDDSQTMSLLKNVFLPISPRFSSVMTINDVICGVVFLGIRLYMEAMKHEQRNAETTSLVLLNTRNIGGYKSISEMVEPEADSPWGNQFAFLHVSVPKIGDLNNPLSFVLNTQKVIKRKRNSAAVVFTGKLLDTLRKWRGPEVTAKYIHSTLKNTSMTISNIMGPLERLALSNQPLKGLYFMVVGVPQNLTITMLSYMGELRVAVGTENGLIDAPKFKSFVQHAFDLIFEAAVPSPSVTN